MFSLWPDPSNSVLNSLTVQHASALSAALVMLVTVVALYFRSSSGTDVSSSESDFSDGGDCGGD